MLPAFDYLRHQANLCFYDSPRRGYGRHGPRSANVYGPWLRLRRCSMRRPLNQLASITRGDTSPCVGERRLSSGGGSGGSGCLKLAPSGGDGD